MRVLLNSAKIFGIKNIDKEISLTFTNKALDDKAFEGSYVKAIYGCNGAGKSGIIHAFEIVEKIATSDFPFRDHIFTPKLIELINKKTRTFRIETSFSFSKSERYRYTLAISLSASKEPYISYESLETLTQRGDLDEIVCRMKDGLLAPESTLKFLGNGYYPVFGRRSSFLFAGLLGEPQQDVDIGVTERKAYGRLHAAWYFFLNLTVLFGGDSDNHVFFDIKSYRNVLESRKNDLSEIVNPLQRTMITSRLKGDRYLSIISPDDEGEYKRMVKRLGEFLKIAKPDLRKIDVRFANDGTWSYPELRFDYDGYSIDYEFESTGVKKLCSLFMALEHSSNYVVIIDEIDAGIHDLFLINLVEYFALYKPCQIIMTTHNIDLMDSVNGLSKSIDILTDEPSIVPWVKKGTLSPISQYKKGYLGGVPTNLTPIDFAPIFNDEE